MGYIIEEITELLGAKILEYVYLSSDQLSTGNTKHSLSGEQIPEFGGLAICQYDDVEFFLFYCDHEWNVLTHLHRETLEDARDQASFEFLNLEGKWIKK
jgi:hypothetical protein